MATPLRSALQLLVRYAAYHRDRRNILTHFVGVPLIVFAVGVQNFAQTAHRAEMPRFDFERAMNGSDTFVVALQHVVERGALVPGLGPAGAAAHQNFQTGFGDIKTPRGDVGGGTLQRQFRAVVVVVHPHIPDRVFNARGVGAVLAGRELVEQFIQTRG